MPHLNSLPTSGPSPMPPTPWPPLPVERDAVRRACSPATTRSGATTPPRSPTGSVGSRWCRGRSPTSTPCAAPLRRARRRRRPRAAYGDGRVEPVPRGPRPDVRARAAGARASTCSTPPTRRPSPASAAALPAGAHAAPGVVEVRARPSRPAATSTGRGRGPPDPARFAVITDPGTELGRAGARARLRRRLREPARHRRALLGAVAVRGRARRCSRASTSPRCSAAASTRSRERAATSPPPANPAAPLAATMAAGVRAGRDKAHLRAPTRASPRSGLWLEQLLAESTGKDGTGVVPIVGEPLGAARASTATTALVPRAQAAAARRAGRRRPPGRRAAGRRRRPPTSARTWSPWELATALAGAAARHPAVRPARRGRGQGGHRTRCSPRAAPRVDRDPAGRPARPGRARRLPRPPGVRRSRRGREAERLEAAPRRPARPAPRAPPPSGSGPGSCTPPASSTRAGPTPIVFVQVVGDDHRRDRRSPAQDFGFGHLKQAQADGDLLTLQARGIRAGPRSRSTSCWRRRHEGRHGRAREDGRQHGRPPPRRTATRWWATTSFSDASDVPTLEELVGGAARPRGSCG